MTDVFFKGDWPAKHKDELKCRVYGSDGKTLVTNLAKELPEMSRRDRRQFARERMKARVANESLQ